MNKKLNKKLGISTKESNISYVIYVTYTGEHILLIAHQVSHQ